MNNDGQGHDQGQRRTEALRQELVASAAYKRGDTIGGQYRVHKALGRGGFGIVYLVSAIDTGTVYALKTFLDEYIFDESRKMLFEKEAKIWVRLGWHQFIVQAHHVRFLDGRMFVAMDYVPVDENGLLSMRDHIVHFGRKIKDQQIGMWLFQFCEAMEYAHLRGVVAHRDIKPDNVLVVDGFMLKISDFGLASALDGASRTNSPNVAGARPSVRRLDGTQICGTPGYMAPEILRAEGSGVASDLYSFGVMLWQIAAGTTDLPYGVQFQGDPERYTKDLYVRQMQGYVPKLESPFWPVIRRCLDPDPKARFSNFEELRSAAKVAMKAVSVPIIDFIVNKDRLSAATFANQGASLRALGLYDEAIACYDRALSLEPTDVSIIVNKANTLSDLDRFDEAMALYDSAIKIEAKSDHAWLNRAHCLRGNGQDERALRSFDIALRINPKNVNAHSGKGHALLTLERYPEAIQCFKAAIDLAPKSAQAWCDFGDGLAHAGQNGEALKCFEKAVAIAPTFRRGWFLQARMLAHVGRGREAAAGLSSLAKVYSTDPAALNEVAVALCGIDHQIEAIPLFECLLNLRPEEAEVMWCNKGNALRDLDREDEALQCYAKSLAINSKYISACIQGAKAHHRLGRLKETVEWYAKAIEIDPRSDESWFGRGSALLELGEQSLAIQCFDRALAIRPKHTMVLYNKGAALIGLGDAGAALECFGKAVTLDPGYAKAWHVKAQIEKAVGLVAEALASCNAYLAASKDVSSSEHKNVLAMVAELRKAKS